MRILLDTNIILRNMLRSDPWHVEVSTALARLVSEGWELCVCAQNVIESWVVMTRPVDVNGLGLDPKRAHEEADIIRSAYEVLPEPPDLLARWLALCVTHQVSGRAATTQGWWR